MKIAANINTMIPNTISNPGVIGVGDGSRVAIDDEVTCGKVCSVDCISCTFGVKVGIALFLEPFIAGLITVITGRCGFYR